MRAGDYWFQCMIWLCLIVIVHVCTGCSGMRVYAGYERVDETVLTQKMVDKSWKCIFVDCGGKNGK